MKNPWKSLTRFELALWLGSVLVVAAAFLLAPARDWLTLTASLIGVTALIFVAKGYVVGQVLTVVFALFYGAISLQLRYYGEMITYLGMTSPIAVAAVVSWIRHPYRHTAEVAVGRMTRTRTAVMFVLTAAVTTGFGFILHALGNASLFWSTVSVATSFLASYLTLMRSEYYACAYAANDVVLIILWVIAALEDAVYFPMVVCFAVFLLNDLYGFVNWRNMRRRQAACA